MSVVRLVHITDTHLRADASSAMRGVNTLESLRNTLHAAGHALQTADAILHTGDAVHDEAGGYDWMQRELGALGKPVLCIPGNHDDPKAMRHRLGKPFEHGGHHDFGSWRIVMLDTHWAGQVAGTLSPSELSRLDDALVSCIDANLPHALVVLHHHPVPHGSAWLDEIGLRNAADFLDILDRHPHVRGTLWGHVHQSFDGRRGAIRMLGTPSTCIQFLPHSTDFALDTLPPAFRTIVLHDDGHIDTAVHWAH